MEILNKCIVGGFFCDLIHNYKIIYIYIYNSDVGKKLCRLCITLHSSLTA